MKSNLTLFLSRNSRLFSALLVMSSLFIASDANSNPMDDEWQAFKQGQAQEFNQYMSELDRAFVKHLEEHWAEFEVFAGRKKQDLVPKPAMPPATKNYRHSAENAIQQTSAISSGETSSSLTPFSNFKIGIKTPSNFKLSILSNKDIANAWKTMASSDFSSTLSYLNNARSQYALGDWAVYLLIREQTQALGLTQNESRLLEWFMLSKLDYNIRLAYDDEQVYVLFPSIQKVYGMAYIQFDQQAYYLATPKTGSGPLRSYTSKYQKSSKILDLSFNKTISASNKAVTSTLYYPSNRNTDTMDSITIQYDPVMSALLSQYPQIDLQYYFSAKPSEYILQSIQRELGPKLRGMTKRQAVNYLLNVIQNGFKYSRDDEQFGEENYLLIEESLRYLTNDCEDRSIFLSYLVAELIDTKVVALDFPGHIALGVDLGEVKPTDWYVKWNGSKYVIADPTYIGANAGMLMPIIKGQVPEIISF